MDRRTLVAVLCGTGTAVLLALGGCGGAVEEVADGAAVARPADEGSPPGERGGARPGKPEAVDGGSRPGAPFDVEAFENLGGPLESFRDSVAATCGGGACTVTEVISEAADAPVGCSVDSIDYDPPAQPAGAEPVDQFIQRGTAVTAYVSCPPDEAEPEQEAPETEAVAPSTEPEG